jgi:hypothetical protein
VVVLLILCLSAPQLPSGSIELRSSQHGCSDLASPSSSSSQIVRAAATADKTFSGGCLAGPESPALHRSSQDAETATARPSDPPNLALDCPPLAPRPPPLA